MASAGGVDVDTVAAVATPSGRGGIGVVRVSGPLASAIGRRVTGLTLVPGRIRVATFSDANGVAVDQGVVLYFASPSSFTGEDVLELQGHGGPVVMQLLVETVCHAGARLARPGEFSERAFLNGKLDLVQAEAVADLIASASRSAARGALRSLQGEFSARVHDLDARLLELRLYVEAAIDFPEEEVDFLAQGQIFKRLAQTQAALDALLADARQGRLLTTGISIAILGAPNVGKSSLLNRLAGEEHAIVTDIPGTTRDLVRADIDIEGLPVHIVDTAGLRESADPVEREGVRRARQQAGLADLILRIEDDTREDHHRHAAFDEVAEVPTLEVLNKVDLSGREPGLVDARTLRVSALTGAGFDALVQSITSAVGFAAQGGTFSARQRHVVSLEAARDAQMRAAELIASNSPGELIAEELKIAHQALGDIVGEMTPDELLGEIFRSFCIGK